MEQNIGLALLKTWGYINRVHSKPPSNHEVLVGWVASFPTKDSLLWAPLGTSFFFFFEPFQKSQSVGIIVLVRREGLLMMASIWSNILWDQLGKINNNLEVFPFLEILYGIKTSPSCASDPQLPRTRSYVIISGVVLCSAASHVTKGQNTQQNTKMVCCFLHYSHIFNIMCFSGDLMI